MAFMNLSFVLISADLIVCARLLFCNQNFVVCVGFFFLFLFSLKILTCTFIVAGILNDFKQHVCGR